MTVTDGRPRVHIVDSLDTAGVSDEIIRGLDDLGVDAAAPASGPLRAVVVLLSQRSFADPVWTRRTEQLSAERLVPVLVSAVDDAGVPPFLAELNWVIYEPDDAGFIARLFTGINTDASRFRDARDTRALAERWDGSGRNPDLLLEDVREVRRRIEGAAVSVDGGEPAMPAELAQTLTGGFGVRYRVFHSILTEDDDPTPEWMAVPMSLWMATFRGIYDKGISQAAEPAVAFLAASRRHAARLRRRRIWRIGYRTTLAAAAAGMIAISAVAIRDAVVRNNNSVSFAIGDSAASNRPDLAAIKAGASLAESGAYSGLDGRLRLTVDALSRHWPVGYLTTGDWMVATAGFLQDGSIFALDNGGTLWHWNLEDGTREITDLEAGPIRGGDTGGDGADVLVTDGAALALAAGPASTTGAAPVSLGTVPDIQALRFAPATGRALVASGDELVVIDGAGPGAAATSLGAWDQVFDIVQTTDGRAIALAAREGQLALVGDDGGIRPVASLPAETGAGALSPDGTSFALEVGGTLWHFTDGELAPTGIVVPGVLRTLAVTDDGVILVSDRTSGTWAADARLGVALGEVCLGFVAVSLMALDADGQRVLCVSGSRVVIDDLATLRPLEVGAPVPAPTAVVTSTGRLASLSLIDDLIRIDRADGSSFALDAAGVSLVSGYEPPDDISDADFFATGALVGASGTPTTVAVTPDGSTFAVGFIDGLVIEVDLNANEAMARVGGWQLPDRAAVAAISWSSDRSRIVVTTASGAVWERSSCAGCWADQALTSRIADRAWLCYAGGDIDELGLTAREIFTLRPCDQRWKDAS